MRRKDRQMLAEDALKLLREQEVGTLSTVDEKGQPYGVPLNYVSDNNHIYFHCALEGQKLDNIKKNNNVCFSVYGDNLILPEQFTTTYESVVVFGIAQIVEEQEKINALTLLLNKFSPGLEKEGMEYIDKLKDRTAVVSITIDTLTGKRHG